MLTSILTLLLIIGLVFWIWRSDHEKGKDTFTQAFLSVLTVFLGIFLALSVNSRHEHRQTIKNLIQIVTVAKSEAEDNLAFIEDNTNEIDEQRLLLESPTTALDVLLDMPAFLEEGSTEIVSELLKLNTLLKWQITYKDNGLMIMGSSSQNKIATPHKHLVVKNIRRVIELLNDQLNLLK
jgi:hypothetical protein